MMKRAMPQSLALRVACLVGLLVGSPVLGQKHVESRATTMPSTREASILVSEPAEPILRWVEVKTESVLFTDREIVRFDWDRQTFELTRERAMDLLSRPHTLQTNFRVCDAHGEIYRGCFMSMASSFTYDGPTIPDNGMYGEVKPPLYRIDAGYPGSLGRDDRRFHPRLKLAMEKAGVLARIDEPGRVVPVQYVFWGWHGDKEKLQIAMEVFSETFRPGRDARLVLRFVGAKGIDLKPDRIEARLTLAAKAEQPTQEPWRISQAVDIPPSVLQPGPQQWQGVFACRIPLAAPAGVARVRPGPAELAVTVTAQRRTAQGIETVGTWTIPPCTVQILPAKTEK